MAKEIYGHMFKRGKDDDYFTVFTEVIGEGMPDIHRIANHVVIWAHTEKLINGVPRARMIPQTINRELDYLTYFNTDLATAKRRKVSRARQYSRRGSIGIFIKSDTEYDVSIFDKLYSFGYTPEQFTCGLCGKTMDIDLAAPINPAVCCHCLRTDIREEV